MSDSEDLLTEMMDGVGRLPRWTLPEMPQVPEVFAAPRLRLLMQRVVADMLVGIDLHSARARERLQMFAAVAREMFPQEVEAVQDVHPESLDPVIPPELLATVERAVLEPEKREAIRQVWGSELTDKDKALLVWGIMRQGTAPALPQPQPDVPTMCSHYVRGCRVHCAVCAAFFPCRLCHDAVVDSHSFATPTLVECNSCGAQQPPQQNCLLCHARFAVYFCQPCVLYLDDPAKDIFHCSGCGLCRLGREKDFFHCTRCNTCVNVQLRPLHTCLPEATARDCPICLEYMHALARRVVFMLCGHAIHQECLDDHLQHSYKCPVCGRSVRDMEQRFRVLDDEISLQPMPQEYLGWESRVKCVDCGGSSVCSYHVLGHKCKWCGSYNTRQVELVKDGEVEEVEVDIPYTNVLSQNFGKDGDRGVWGEVRSMIDRWLQHDNDDDTLVGGL